MILGTIAGGVGVSTTIETTFLPQFISFDAAAPTSIRVNVLGDGVICDITAAAIPALRSMRYFSQVTATEVLLPLANGLVKGKNVQITIVNSAAAAFTLYGTSITNNGNVYVQSLTQNVLASSGAMFSRFAFLALPSIAATDILNILYQDGLVQQTDRFELPAMLQMSQGINGASIYGIDNFEGKIKSVQFTPTAAQLVFMVRFSAVGDVSQTF
jgi:hypothetical protein